MSDHGFTTSFSVDRTPKEAFDAITNVRGWWSEEFDGGTVELGNEFRYRYEDVHRCTIRVTEVVPDRRVGEGQPNGRGRPRVPAEELAKVLPTAGGDDIPALPAVVDRATRQAERDALLVREKAHTREGDAIAAARRRLPMERPLPRLHGLGR
ncbi:MAG: DUF899 family protein, partial [Pseudonocardiaceae bacterium]